MTSSRWASSRRVRVVLLRVTDQTAETIVVTAILRPETSAAGTLVGDIVRDGLAC